MAFEHDDRLAYEFTWRFPVCFSAQIQHGIINLMPFDTSRHGENSGIKETASQCGTRPFSSHFKLDCWTKTQNRIIIPGCLLVKIIHLNKRESATCFFDKQYAVIQRYHHTRNGSSITCLSIARASLGRGSRCRSANRLRSRRPLQLGEIMQSLWKNRVRGHHCRHPYEKIGSAAIMVAIPMKK